jgi:CheY-like chemotaxis protein
VLHTGTHSLDELKSQLDGFYRANLRKRRSSLGLRLPIAAKVMQLHGGRLEALDSGRGATMFRATLPAFAAAVSAAESLAVTPKAGGILLVEDDVDCREVLAQLLDQEGYRVISTSTAGEARAILANIRPAMVLLDLRLSDDDGRVVLHFIRESEALRDTPVYIVSGANELAALAAGSGVDRIDGYFEKPLQLPKLLDTIAQVVRPAREV